MSGCFFLLKYGVVDAVLLLHQLKDHICFKKYYIYDTVTIVILQLCTVSVVVGMDAELNESSVNDVNQTEDRIVSQWREVSADEKHELRDQVDEILRPLGLQTRLLVVERANSLALYFICMTLAALMSLRDQWRRQQLRDIVQSLITFFSDDTDIVQSLFDYLLDATRTVRVWRLTWPLSDYNRCLEFFSSVLGK